MRTFRKERVASLIQRELGKMLSCGVEFPDGVLVTITGVDVGEKLEHAKVFLSVFPSTAIEAALEVVEKVRGELQYRLMKKINIKPMPKIKFVIDYGPERAAEVEKVLLKGNNK